jgi:hypothetical protein
LAVNKTATLIVFKVFHFLFSFVRPGMGRWVDCIELRA